MAPEQLLLLAALILVWLVNLLARWLRARREPRPAGPSPVEPAAYPPPPLGPPIGLRAAPPSTPVLEPAAVAPSTAAPDRARRHVAGVRLGDPAELRRAVVLMTVFGPCRALQDERA